MDSYYQDQQGYVSMLNQGSGYTNGDHYEACGSLPSSFPSVYGGQERGSFEDIVMQKLDVLQAQMNAMALRDEEEKRKSFEAKVMERLDLLEAKMDEMAERNDLIRQRTWELIQAELTDTEKTLTSRFEKHLKVLEEQSVNIFEEYSKRTTNAIEKLESRVGKILKKYEEEPGIEAVVCQVQRLEYRMETEMRQLFHGMYRAQGRFQERESDDDLNERMHLFKELPGHIDESDEEDAESDCLEENCEPTSPISSANDEDERVHEHSVDLEGTREVDHGACSSGEERDHSIGSKIPIHQEEPSSPPSNTSCHSCEWACTPQVKACFGVLASGSLKEKSHEDLRCEEKGNTVGGEVPKRKSKKKRAVVAQVWIPRGTLAVMKVFNMTEINLGEKSCIPHKAKKRRRRRKASKPQSGVG